MTILTLHADSWDFMDKTNTEFDCILTDPMYEEPFFLEKLRRICSGNIIVFCQPENEFFVPDERAYWIKTPSTKNYSKHLGRFVEHILILRGETFNNDLHWSNYTGVYTDMIEEKKVHEFQKPISLIERLIRIYTKPHDYILDPFMGSGTTLVAASRLGRNVVGIDIKEENVNITNQRLGI